ncbi:unnamed protein product, partial [Meganyctiphanes norvegica]
MSHGSYGTQLVNRYHSGSVFGPDDRFPGRWPGVSSGGYSPACDEPLESPVHSVTSRETTPKPSRHSPPAPVGNCRNTGPPGPCDTCPPATWSGSVL